jgi:hypothetical protein
MPQVVGQEVQQDTPRTFRRRDSSHHRTIRGGSRGVAGEKLILRVVSPSVAGQLLGQRASILVESIVEEQYDQ